MARWPVLSALRLNDRHPTARQKHRPGLFQCNDCRERFTVTVNTVCERSKIPLSKWCMAIYLLNSSKKGMSALQMNRMMGGSYKTAWFMMHRIREAMREGKLPGGLGGQNKVVEADETYVGGKARNRKNKVPAKTAVLSLVERDGKVRSFPIGNVTATTLRPIIVSHVSRASYLMTDESPVYPVIGREFAGHGTVNHSAEEYVRAHFWHTNTVEGYSAPSSAASWASTIGLAKRTCTVTRPSSISAITIASRSATPICSAPKSPLLASMASD